jgi:hypothetical protein
MDRPRQNQNRTENEIENIFVNRNMNIYKLHYVKYSINELMKLCAKININLLF